MTSSAQARTARRGAGPPGVTRAGWLAFILAALVIVLDQALKQWVVTGLGLAVGESRPLFWPLSFTLVRNDGISFGFFQTHAPWTRWALAGFALAVSAMLIAWVRRADRLVTGVAGGLILGGALGNLIDRIRLGAVVDFVDVHPLVFPWIFNLADSGITVGVIILLAENLLLSRIGK
jgi:signal peptidase II